MAITSLSDVYVPSMVDPYVSERTAEVSRLVQSGVIRQLPAFDERAKQKGRKVDIPFFQDLGRGSLSGGFDSQAHTDADDITVNSRSGANQEALKHRRANAWGAADLVSTVLGDDPMDGIANLLGDYWASEVQLHALMTLNGVFDSGDTSASALGSNSDDPHFVDVYDSGETIVGSESKGYPVLEAANKLGDNWSSVTAICVHSKVLLDMQKADIIDFVSISDQLPDIPFFMGKEVIVDDTLPVDEEGTSETSYLSYLFGEGAFAYGEGAPKVPSEVERSATTNGGQEILVSRKHFVVHPNGISFTGSISGETATKAELETASNYALKYEHKNVPIVAIKSQ